VGDVTRVELIPDKPEIAASTQDLVYVEIALLDEVGLVHPTIESTVEIEIEGPAKLQGLGSSTPRTEQAYPFIGSSCTTCRGRALAAIRYCPGQENSAAQGQVTVKVKCGELPVSAVVLSVVA
jgi:hypothetical protein